MCLQKEMSDILTQTKKSWLVRNTREVDQETVAIWCLDNAELEGLHNMHHMAVDKTLYFVLKVEAFLKRKAFSKGGEKLC